MSACTQCGTLRARPTARFCPKCGTEYSEPLNDASKPTIPMDLSSLEETVRVTAFRPDRKKEITRLESLLNTPGDKTEIRKNRLDEVKVLEEIPQQVSRPTNTHPGSNGASSPPVEPPLPILEITDQESLAPEKIRLKNITKRLFQERLSTLESLISLLVFVDKAYYQDNKDLLERMVYEKPELGDNRWEKVSLISGRYGKHYSKQNLSQSQRCGLWNALLWSILYEQVFRPEHVDSRQRDLIDCFKENADHSDFLVYATEDLRKLAGSIPKEGNLRRLRDVLAKVPSSPAIDQIRQQIQDRLPAEPGSIESWGRVVSDFSPRLFEQQTKLPDALLNNEHLLKLETAIHSGHIPEALVTLTSLRTDLLKDLRDALDYPQFVDILPPILNLQSPDKNKLAKMNEAMRLSREDTREEKHRAVQIFEEIYDNRWIESHELALEWLLFAKAGAYSRASSRSEWYKHYEQGQATSEEIWNLAKFDAQASPFQALEILKTGIEARKAPLSHLYLALSCAVRLLLQQESNQRQQALALQFLVKHLLKLPLLESYLVWPILNQEMEAHNNQKQIEVLGKFQELRFRPIPILSLSEYESEKLDRFKKNLSNFSLQETWILWLNGYVRTHFYQSEGWLRLGQALEEVDDLTLAEQAFEQPVKNALSEFQYQYKQGTPDPQVLREMLQELFRFYAHHSNLRPVGKNAFERYKQAVPALWKNTEPTNQTLIQLTKSYQEPAQQSHGQIPAQKEPEPDFANKLNSELDKMREIAAEIKDQKSLKHWQKELQSKIDGLLPQKSNHKKLFQSALSQLAQIDFRSATLDKIKKLGEAVKETRQLTQQERSLHTFAFLVDAFDRVLSTKDVAPKIHSEPRIELVPRNAGLPSDVSHTSLVMRVINSSVSEILNVKISCQGDISALETATLDLLPSMSEAIISMPINVSTGIKSQQADCQVTLSYQTLNKQSIQKSFSQQVSLFTFHDLLRQYAISGYELPNPYLSQSPLDPEKHALELFQGRERDIERAQNFVKGEKVERSLYFYGNPRIGKSSLMYRLRYELKQSGVYPLLIELQGLDSSHHSLAELIHHLSERLLESAARQGLNIEYLQKVSINHPNPRQPLEKLFEHLHKRTGGKQLVVLLDDVQAVTVTPILNALNMAQQLDHARFILAGSLTPKQIQQCCPTTSLFLSAYQITLLQRPAVIRMLRQPLGQSPVVLPEATIERIYVQTMGQPYLVARLASAGLERLNIEHRLALAPGDIDQLAGELARDPQTFPTSTFNPSVLSLEEMEAAIALAKTLPPKQEYLSAWEAFEAVKSRDVFQQLEARDIVERQGNSLKIKGEMLLTFLRHQPEGIIAWQHAKLLKKHQRVGIFVDLENVWQLASRNMTARGFGRLLSYYASRFGELVCCWACADPRNIVNAEGISQELEKAGFMFGTPAPALQQGRAKENTTDFVMLESITFESFHSKPDIYILVSGDRDFYTKIHSLLDSGHTVRLLASKSSSHLSTKYYELEAQRKQKRRLKGFEESDFFIDDLDALLH